MTPVKQGENKAQTLKISQLARQLNRESSITIPTIRVELRAVKSAGYKHKRAKLQPTTRESKQLKRKKNTAKPLNVTQISVISYQLNVCPQLKEKGRRGLECRASGCSARVGDERTGGALGLREDGV